MKIRHRLKNNSKEFNKILEGGAWTGKKIKAEKKIDTLENHLKKLESISKASIACQTNHSIDVPYSVSEVLSHSFGSHL